MREVIRYIVRYDWALNKLLNLNNQLLRDLKIRYSSDEEIISKHEVENGYLADSLVSQYQGFFLKFDFIDEKKNDITFNIKVFFKQILFEIDEDEKFVTNKEHIIAKYDISFSVDDPKAKYSVACEIVREIDKALMWNILM